MTFVPLAAVWPTAVLALCGVVVGGAINLVSGIVLDRRRQGREIRTAARLIVTELASIRDKLEDLLRRKTWGAISHVDVTRWTEHEGQLAAALDNSDWTSVHSLYRSIRLFSDEASDFAGTDEVTAEDLAHARLTLDVLADALPRLKRLAGEDMLMTSERAERRYRRYIEAGGGPVE